MRVVYVTESHEERAGGIPTVVDQLARHIASRDIKVDILSVGREPMKAPSGARLTNSVPAPGAGAWRWSSHLRNSIQRLASGDGDESIIFHLHGTWLASHWYGARIAKAGRIPMVLSVHGQLEPFHWTDRGVLHLWKKRIYWRLMAFPAFRSARVIHAITRQEQEHLSTFFNDVPIVIIPNAVDLTQVDQAVAALPYSVKREPAIGFLGRFHEKKGVDILIRAFTEAGLPDEWRLLLAGPPGRPGYMREVKDLVAASPLRNRIEFVGPLSGDSKWYFYRRISVLAMPSHSEVIGMVNLEAAACGTPTITTHETGLEDWDTGGGVLIHPEVEGLAQALRLICLSAAEEYRRRSIASRRLVENRYSWTVIYRRWLDLYHSIANRNA